MKLFEGSKTILMTLATLIVLPLLDLAFKWDFKTWLEAKLCAVAALAGVCVELANSGSTIYMAIVGAVIIYLRSKSVGPALAGVKDATKGTTTVTTVETVAKTE